MIEGRVSSALRAILPLAIQDGNGNWRTLPFTLDTGYTGYLALPASFTLQLGLTLDGFRTASSATQQSVPVRYGYTRIIWQGHEQLTRFLEAGTHPLLGMSLLRNHHIAIDAVADGAVAVAPLPI